MYQYFHSLVKRVLGWGSRDPRFDSQEGRNFFHLNLFLRGNEPNGEQEQEQQEQQLKKFLSLWPMAADKKDERREEVAWHSNLGPLSTVNQCAIISDTCTAPGALEHG